MFLNLSSTCSLDEPEEGGGLQIQETSYDPKWKAPIRRSKEKLLEKFLAIIFEISKLIILILFTYFLCLLIY